MTGAGDELQGMKKGVMELADAIVVNKADGDNKQRAMVTRAEYERILQFYVRLPKTGRLMPIPALLIQERELWNCGMMLSKPL